MSTSQEVFDFNSPSKPVPEKRNRRNRIGSPLHQSANANPTKKEVFELFTVKSSSTQPKLTLSDSQETSEISDDVFIKPKTLSSPSKSETKSYRDKINDRFRNIKQKAGQSRKKANVFKETAENILLEKIKRESGDIDAELELMRERLKLKKTDNQDLYDFFCGKPDEEQLESSEDLMEFALPKLIRSTLQTSEAALFYKAKASSTDISDKIEADEPRCLEDDGFYVAPQPDIPTQHAKLLEYRLSRDDKKWFTCEGKLNIVENPCQKTSLRPRFKPSSLDEIATYLPAALEDDTCEEIVVVRDNLLQLQISSLTFTHHPLFSVEHVLARKLQKLFDEYDNGLVKNVFVRLSKRLEGLRSVVRRLEETSSQSGDHSDKEDRTNAFRRDIKALQEQVFQEGKKERDRLKAILQTWKAVKKIRRENKHTNTSVKLIIHKEKVDYANDKEKYDQTFEETLDDYFSYNREKPRRARQTEDEIREEVSERFKESFRQPGEPILRFSLVYDHETSKSVENSRETDRRSVVASTKIGLKILCNKVEVCKTKFICLQDDFCCQYNESISIQLTTVPKFLTVEIVEQPKSLIKRTLGEMIIKIPARTDAQSDWKAVDFVKNEIVHYKHNGVGSGIKLEELFKGLSVEIEENEELNTSGTLQYSLAWESPVADTDSSSKSDKKTFDQIIDKHGAIDLDKLSEWIHQNKPDPQDPRNSIFYEFSLNCDQTVPLSDKKNYFRLNQNALQFCDPKIVENNLRLKVLQLRNKNEPEFDRMMVPNRLKEIPRNILADYERRVANEKENVIVENDDDDDYEIEKKRSRGRKHLKQIHIRVFQKCKNSQNNLTFEDVVDEKFLPHLEKLIRSLFLNFIAWFRWRPLLKPPPLEFKSSGNKSDCFEFCSQTKISIAVISALNVRTKSVKKDEEISVFVEAEYNHFTTRTTTRQGAHPTWNETLILPLDSSHSDYLNPNSLNGTITVNIFDENETVLAKYAGEKSRNWMGSIEIPLSAICFTGIQGMFKVKTPHLLFGYDEKNLEIGRHNTQANQDTYLHLQIVMEPNIPKLNPSVEELPCSEVPYIKEHALKWNEEYNANFPNRKFPVLAIDAGGSTTCIVRYIKPLEPPQINVEGFDVTPEQCARFVSLIPFTDCNQFYRNIWLPTDRFLNYMVGSITDHAVALTCYLLALKLDAWLLLGFGVPYGYAAFVLVKEYNNQTTAHYIYDVVLGKKIQLSDAFCPLQKVYCLVNEHNVWANIQRNDDVTVMRFDLTRRSDWLTLFNNQTSAPTTSIQNKLIYSPKPETSEIEIVIDRKIRRRIAKLRQLDRTVWNHQVSNTFKSVLGVFEKAEMYGKSSSEAVEKIADCMATYQIRGHVLCLPFVDFASVARKVKSYGLHLEDDGVQFASAVCVKAYPTQVLAVWIFIAVIKEKNREVAEVGDL